MPWETDECPWTVQHNNLRHTISDIFHEVSSSIWREGADLFHNNRMDLKRPEFNLNLKNTR